MLNLDPNDVDDHGPPYPDPTRWERVVLWLRGYGIDKYLIGSIVVSCTAAVLIGGLLNYILAR